ncbi:homeobox protein ATH1 [Coffea eugenioides]|uniref:homeobox protein ATH1 n=1 Tax=Coffea eugenioides TaxID=49369 RepID=UPI000F60793D|nr:homeobox protein ATH1 [Coffea eugenioides]
MPIDMTEPSSGNPFDANFLSSSELIVLNNRDRILSGIPGPSVVQGDGTSSQAWIHEPNSGRISDSYMLRNTLPEREPMGVVPYGASHQISSTQVQDRYMEGVPLSAASIATLLAARSDNQENLEKPVSSAPLIYPLEIPRSIVLNDNADNLNPSHSSMRYGYDGLPASTSTKWDFNNFAAHPELAGAAVGRTGLQPFESMMNLYPNEWITSENANLDSDSPSGCSRLSNELSLSLAMTNPSVVHRTSIQDQCSEICGSSSPCERCLGSEQTSCNRNLSLGFGSYRPVQLSQFLSGSRYIHVMQELLAEIAAYSLGSLDLMKSPAIGMEDRADASISSSCTAVEGYLSAASEDFSDASNIVRYQIDPVLPGRNAERKKKQLLGLLEAVDDRYNECLDEIHTVISAFHAVTELDPPIHARFALQTISFLYKNLRERISNHILAMGAHLSQGVVRENEESFEASFIQKQWALQQLKRKDNQLWRPQRGLPERSVSVLRAWMFQNFLHPYPKDAEKHLLAMKSGLTRSQVSNWFINARVRLWKPMIEEMYSEMNRRKIRHNDEETNSNQRSRVSLENGRFSMY